MPSRIAKQFDIPEREDKLAIFDGSYLTDIPSFLDRWNSKRIVLVVSKALYNNHKYIQALEHKFGDRLVGEKIGVGSHSPYKDVIEIAHLIQDNNADCLITIGSSSYTDASKIASKLANTLPPGFTAEDVEGLVDEEKGLGYAKEAAVKVILVPTSLSAAEWNVIGSCTNASGKKQHFASKDRSKGAVDLIICDPELANTAPESLWLPSGVRCVDHCVETICNRYCTEDAEEDALQGLAEMLKGLVEYKEGIKSDREKLINGISKAQKGSRQAIKALIMHGNSMGPSHAIGHQLGSVAGVAHGVTSCLMLAPVLRYTSANADKNPAFSRAKEGQAKVLKVFNDTFSWEETSAADAVTKFVKQLELPTKLSEAGVTDEDQLDQIAKKTLTDIWGRGEKQITEQEEVRKILDSVR